MRIEVVIWYLSSLEWKSASGWFRNIKILYQGCPDERSCYFYSINPHSNIPSLLLSDTKEELRKMGLDLRGAKGINPALIAISLIWHSCMSWAWESYVGYVIRRVCIQFIDLLHNHVIMSWKPIPIRQVFGSGKSWMTLQGRCKLTTYCILYKMVALPWK